MSLKTFLKKIPGYRIPRIIRDTARFYLGYFVYEKILLPRLLKKLRKKEKIRVVFTAWNVSMWKYDLLYRAMQKHPRFEPIVVLTPRKPETQEHDVAEMRRVFSARNYVIADGVQGGRFGLEFDKKLSPDLVFFTQPYGPPYLCHENWKYVFGYCPYGFPTGAIENWQYNNFMQNIAWKIFCSTKEAVDDARACTLNKAKNCVCSGYLFGDELSARTATESVWKNVAGTPKRVIWSPHFSISENALFRLSNFLRLHQAMLDFAEEFRGKIQWAFKPHPFLFPTLCDAPDWGRERAVAYFEKWENLENAQLELDGYADLFASSDAIIHDCGSFTVEYLYTRKPAMYLRIPDKTRAAGDLGKEALACYYQGFEKSDIRHFLENVVLGGNDPLRSAREQFYEKHLRPPNNKSVAENILDEIERGLCWKN